MKVIIGNLYLESLTTINIVLLAVLLTSSLIQLYYYLFIFIALSRWKPEKHRGKLRSISVIICAKNEADNLQRNLPAFLEQDYPDFEVVVVNDCSTDDTENVLSEFKARYERLHYTTIPLDRKFTHGKKLAITVGIKAAKYQHFLFSDADCYPLTDQWLKKMASHFTNQNEIVLGIGKYEQRRGLLNMVIRYETFFTAIQYISFALKGRPYMGVGRNLAYTKELFFRHKGFASHLKILSGDDDLFVNEAATKRNTTVELSVDSFTISKPPVKWKSWFSQKKRHLSSSNYYKNSSKILLGMEYLSRFLMYGSFIWMLFIYPWRWAALLIYLVVTTVKILVTKLSMRRLEERNLLLPSLFLDPAMLLILITFRISNTIRPRKAKWN